MWLRPIVPERRRPRAPRNAGFVLVEVLVATAVAAIIMAALVRAFAANWTSTLMVREEAEAMVIARAVMNAAGARATLKVGTQDGRTGRYGWTVAVTKQVPATVSASEVAVSDASPNWTLYRISISVAAPSGRKTVLETLRLGRNAQATQ